jgi:uncharacterized protein (TIGR03437 family)
MPACALAAALAAAGSLKVTTRAPSHHNIPQAMQWKDSSAPAATKRGRVLEQYAQLPLYFEPNLGQTDARVQYLARAGGYTLFLTPGEAVMVLSRRNGSALRSPRWEPPATLEQVVVRMRIEGADRGAPAVGLERQPGISAYFLGNDPAQWRPEVPHYGRVEYKGIYPGVDLVYHGDQRQVEYDFVVRLGADPGQIRLAYEGAEELRVDRHGDLVLATRLGELKQHKPRVYQEIGGRRVEVAARYRLEGGRVGVEVAAYDRQRPLIIDPVLTYSTYLGGSNFDSAWDIAVDAAGVAYVAGSTSSANFPTANAYQAGFAGGSYHAFVTKLNPDGGSGAVTLVYSTYLGGRGSDYAYGIAVDATGAAYVAGTTFSANFPTANAYQAGFGGLHDAFVAKLDPYAASGAVTLAYSTYLGGSGSDCVEGIAVDAAGAAYVAGWTGSANFPTANAYQAVLGGGYDAFVTKLNPYGGSGAVTLAYSTYLGGSSFDAALDAAVDAAGAAYVAGGTASSNFPTTNAYQASYRGGDQDAFVTKLNPYGGSGAVTLAYSTYLGGSGLDQAEGIAVDAAGAAYVAGWTESANFPAANACQASFGGFRDAFVAKLGPYGGSGAVTLAYSTYLGGSGNDLAFSIAVDAAGAAYVGGGTKSANFPTANAYQASFGGVEDAFVTKLDPYGGSGAVTLAYSTYLGGSSDDAARAIAVDATGAAYVSGFSYSANFSTTHAYQVSLGGSQNAFVAKFQGYPTVPATVRRVLNSASYLPGAVAPGEILYIEGSNMGPTSLIVATPTPDFPTALSEVQVLFDGTAAPIYYVKDDKISAVVPWGIVGRASTRLVVEYRGQKSTEVVLQVVAAAPGIYTTNSAGYGQGAILNQDYSLNGAARPVAKGSVIMVYGTGGGITSPLGVDGAVTPAIPHPYPLSASAILGGVTAKVIYAGGAPGLISGAMQVNIQIPSDAPSGPSVPLVISIGATPTQANVTVAIQ